MAEKSNIRKAKIITAVVSELITAVKIDDKKETDEMWKKLYLTIHDQLMDCPHEEKPIVRRCL